MKKLFAIILSLLMLLTILCSCAEKEELPEAAMTRYGQVTEINGSQVSFVIVENENGLETTEETKSSGPVEIEPDGEGAIIRGEDGKVTTAETTAVDDGLAFDLWGVGNTLTLGFSGVTLKYNVGSETKKSTVSEIKVGDVIEFGLDEGQNILYAIILEKN